MSRILYVEDDALLQLDGEALLLEAGYDVILAADGQMACEYLREADARYDALITDIDLGGDIQGWQVAKAIREINSATAVIYVTGHSARDFEKMRVSRSLMIPKPFEWRSVLASLSDLIIAAAELEASGGRGAATRPQSP